VNENQSQNNQERENIIEPYSKIEILLAEALKKENIPYESQYRVYENPKDLVPKYTLDFLIRAGEKLINVECDGYAYHSGRENKQKDAIRNAWLFHNGFSHIIRFDSIDIKYNINYCTNVIKKILSIYTGVNYFYKRENKQADKYKLPPKKSSYILNIVSGTKIDKVNIYAASSALSYEKDTKGAIAYQLEDVSRAILSNEFSFAYSGVNKKRCQTLSVLEALKRMKKPSAVTIYTDSKWIANVCNCERLLSSGKNLDDFGLFVKLDVELSKHNYRFICLRKINGTYSNKIFRNLASRAMQKAHRTSDEELIEFYM